MKQLCLLFFIISLLTSCLNHNDDSNFINTKIDVSEVNNTVNNGRANIDDIWWFFGLIPDTNPDSNHYDPNLFFFNKNDINPLRRVAVDTISLGESRFLKLKNTAVLVLANYGENKVHLFIKQTEKKIDQFWEDNTIPSKVVLKQLNDTLVVCEFFWKYQFGPDLHNVRKYYFIGEKMGVFKYGYSSVDFINSPLDIDNFVLSNNGILFKDKKYNDTLLVLPDTVKLLKSSNNDFASRHISISFNSVRFKFDGWSKKIK